MASSVASPLERQFTTIAGVDSMMSSSGAGSTNITLQFDLGRDIDSATVDVQTAIAAAMPLLPPTHDVAAVVPQEQSRRPADPDAEPDSKTLPMSALDEYAENMIAPRISMVNGVSQVQVQGAAKYAVRVQMDPDKLHAQQIGINEVDQALRTGTSTSRPASCYGPHADLQHQGHRPVDERRRRSGRSIVTYRNGAPVRLSRSRNVIDSVENVYNGNWFYQKTTDGKRRRSAPSRCR